MYAFSCDIHNMSWNLTDGSELKRERERERERESNYIFDI